MSFKKMYANYCDSNESNLQRNSSCDSRCVHCNESRISNFSEEYLGNDDSSTSEQSTKSLDDLPVEISEGNSTFIDLPPLHWRGYNYTPKNLTVTNTGRTILINGRWTCSKPYIRGGPLNGNYIFSQIHFHCPSEHKIDGKRFPLEMHVVHYKTCYLTQERAMHERDGTVVLVYLFKERENGSTVLGQITNLMPYIEKTKSEKEITNLTLEQIVQPFTSNYYVYWGSVKTEKKSYLLQWIINCNYLCVSKEELSQMLKIMKASGSFNSNRLARMKPENNAVFRVARDEREECPKSSKRTGSDDIKTKNSTPEMPGVCVQTEEQERSKPETSKTDSFEDADGKPIKGSKKKKEKAVQAVETMSKFTNTSPQLSRNKVQKEGEKEKEPETVLEAGKITKETQTEKTMSDTSTLFHSDGESIGSDARTKDFFKSKHMNRPLSQDPTMASVDSSGAEKFKVSDNKDKPFEPSMSKSESPDSSKAKSSSTPPRFSKSDTSAPENITPKEKSKSSIKSIESVPGESGSKKSSKSRGSAASEVNPKAELSKTTYPLTKGSTEKPPDENPKNEEKSPDFGKGENENKEQGTQYEKIKKKGSKPKPKKSKLKNESKEKGKKKKDKKGGSQDCDDPPCDNSKKRNKINQVAFAQIYQGNAGPELVRSAKEMSQLFQKTVGKQPNEKLDAFLEKLALDKRFQVNFLMSPNIKASTLSAAVLTTESESTNQIRESSDDTESQDDSDLPAGISMNNVTPFSSETLLNTIDMENKDEPVNQTTGNTKTMQVDTMAKENENCDHESKELFLRSEHSLRSEKQEANRPSITCQEYYVAIEYGPNILQEFRGVFDPYRAAPGSLEKPLLFPDFKESKGLQIRLEDRTIKVDPMDLVCVESKFLLKEGSVHEMLSSSSFFTNAHKKLFKLLNAESDSVMQEFVQSNFIGERSLEGNIFKLSQGTQWEDLNSEIQRAGFERKVTEERQRENLKKISGAENHGVEIRKLKDRGRKSRESSEAEEALERRQCKMKLLKNPVTYRDENFETTSSESAGKESEGPGSELTSEAKRSIDKYKKTVYFMYDRIEKDAVTGKKIFVGSFRTKEEVEAIAKWDNLLPEKHSGKPFGELERSEPAKEKITQSYPDDSTRSVNVYARMMMENLSFGSENNSEQTNVNLKNSISTLRDFDAEDFGLSKDKDNVLIDKVVNRLQAENANFLNVSAIMKINQKSEGKFSIRDLKDFSKNYITWSGSDKRDERTRASMENSTDVEIESCRSDRFSSTVNDAEKKSSDEGSTEHFGSTGCFSNPKSANKASQSTIILIPIEVESFSNIELILIEHANDVKNEKKKKEYIPCLNCYKRS